MERSGFKMKRNKKTFDFGNKGKFDIKSKKRKNKKDWSTDMYGERDFSEHNIHARKTEGTIKEQEKLRRDREYKKYSDLEKYDTDRD
tara:strand:- start:133 stop:393 length:261 start_codon:yes stop_codon:yes gene_type:complete